MDMKLGRSLGKTVEQVEKLETAMARGPIGYVIQVARANRNNILLVKELDGIKVTTDEGLEAKVGGVKDALLTISQIEDAVYILEEKGRVYTTKEGRKTIHVWSKDAAELRTLKQVYGGNYYRHGSGFLWMVAHAKVLSRIQKETDLEVFDVHDLFG